MSISPRSPTKQRSSKKLVLDMNEVQKANSRAISDLQNEVTSSTVIPGESEDRIYKKTNSGRASSNREVE